MPPEFQSADNMPVPIEVVVMIGDLLVGARKWAAMHNGARRDRKRWRKAKWQAKADPVWQRNPLLSERAVAKIIAPDEVEAVRKLITKPKK